MARPLMYGPLAPWFHLLTAPADYAEEAAFYAAALDRAAARPIRRLLELGSGGGNVASHLKARYAMTLVDLSPAMLETSRTINPECEHVAGDMRHLRLGRTFDAVLIHDAIMYMTSEADLAAAFAAAAAHLAPGGVALFVPDDTAESYQPGTSTGGHDRGERSLRYLEWNQPPRGSCFTATFAIMTKEGPSPVRVDVDQHTLGLFPRAAWLSLLDRAGFAAQALPYEHSTFEVAREMFLGTRRP